MKSLLNISLFIALTAVLLSCESDEDFTTPDGVVKTFIKAGTEKDKDLLSECFIEDSYREWKKIKDKSITDQELDDLKDFVEGAKVTGVKLDKTRRFRRRRGAKRGANAVVSVKFKSRDEEIHVQEVDHRWYIVDF